MMLTDKDRSVLLAVVGKRGTVMQVTIACMVVFQVGMAAVKFYMAGRWVELTEYSFRQFLHLWMSGVSVDARYPGALINAGDDMTIGALLIGCALILTCVWWRGRRVRELTQRIVNTLKSGGAWERAGQ